MHTPAIILNRVSKKYTIHHEKPTFVEKFISNRVEEYIALNDVSLIVNKGERVGIVGQNGAGKTTLLKIISGITQPTVGEIYRNGRVVSLIDLEAGFQEDLTGLQNIFLNGLILGMKKTDIEKKLNDIVTFADIKQFIDAPLFTYSQGMKLRLGFSVAIHSDPQILLLDEIITVGDKNFQEKSMRKIKSLFKTKITILIASHLEDYLLLHTSKMITLNQGRLIK